MKLYSWLIIGLVLTLLLMSCGEWPGGMGSGYPAKDFDPRLTQEAMTGLPIIKGVKRYFEVNKEYPKGFNQLKDCLPDGESIPDEYQEFYMYKRWHYIKMSQGYRISKKLGWDPALVYDSDTQQWTFVPGDGSPEKVIKLKVP